MRAPRRAGAAVVPALALLLAACGGGSGTGDDVAGTEDDPVTRATVVSTGLSFDVGRIVVPAGEEVTLTYDNRDDGVPHNLHVKAEASDGEEPKTGIEPGPDRQSVTFAYGEPGEHRYVCDVHPQMQGTLVVVAPGE